MSLYSTVPDPESDPGRFVKKISLFNHLPDDDLQPVVQSLQRRQFAANVTLFHQDMPGIMLYMIESGHTRIFSLGRTGQELTFEIFGPGDIFGELSILDEKPHSASAITLSPSVIWMAPKRVIDQLLNDHPEVGKEMIRVLVRRVRSRARYAEAMTFQDVQGRVAYTLLNLAEQFGSAGEEGLEIELPLTQVDISAIIGVTRESVNKALVHLRANDMVKIEGTRITLLKPGALRMILQARGR